MAVAETVLIMRPDQIMCSSPPPRPPMDRIEWKATDVICHVAVTVREGVHGHPLTSEQISRSNNG